MSMLYHYTGQASIIGIIQSRSIWATHTNFLNDSSEFFHALAFAEDFGTDLYMDDYFQSFGYALRQELDKVIANEIYVASFTEKPDLLSQWRGYCPAGGGVGIGFDLSALETFCKRQGYKLEKCVYDHQEQKKQIRSLVKRCSTKFPKSTVNRKEFEALASKEQIDAMIDYDNQIKKGSCKLEADAALAWFSTEIAELAPLFKNDGFHEEAEWRIVAKSPKEEVKFRSGSSYLVPYVELEFLAGAGSNTLREIIIGPNPNQLRYMKSITMLLAANGFAGVELKNSPLPYNSW